MTKKFSTPAEAYRAELSEEEATVADAVGMAYAMLGVLEHPSATPIDMAAGAIYAGFAAGIEYANGTFDDALNETD